MGGPGILVGGQARTPAYFVPAGCPGPGHTRYAPGEFALWSSAEQAEGLLAGAVSFTGAAGGWVRSVDGWWVHLRGARPADLLRTRRLWPATRLVGHDGEAWLVPRLLKPASAWTLEDGLVPAVEVLGPDGRWRLPPELEDLCERLRRSVLAARAGEPEPEGCDLGGLVVAVLAEHYRVTATELGAGGWIERAFAVEVLVAACGLGAADPAAGA